MIQVLAPLVEGSTETQGTLVERITEKYESLGIPEPMRAYIKEPEELLNACFTKRENLPPKLMSALLQFKDIDASGFPNQFWQVNMIEMLAPKFKPANVKKIRQKRRSFQTKVELLVSLISQIEQEPVDLELTEEALEGKITKLNKIENEEYLSSLKNMINQDRQTNNQQSH